MAHLQQTELTQSSSLSQLQNHEAKKGHGFNDHLLEFLASPINAVIKVCRCADNAGRHPTTTTTITTVLWPFVQDYPSEPVPEETFNH